MQKYSPGSIVKGTVTSIKPYGAFISLEEGVTGLLHISEIADSFVSDVNKYVQVGEELDLKVLDVDEETGHVKLSLKAINRKKYRRKHNLSEEVFVDEDEFRTLGTQMPKFIKETKEMLENQEK